MNTVNNRESGLRAAGRDGVQMDWVMVARQGSKAGLIGLTERSGGNKGPIRHGELGFMA